MIEFVKIMMALALVGVIISFKFISLNETDKIDVSKKNFIKNHLEEF